MKPNLSEVNFPRYQISTSSLFWNWMNALYSKLKSKRGVENFYLLEDVKILLLSFEFDSISVKSNFCFAFDI